MSHKPKQKQISSVEYGCGPGGKTLVTFTDETTMTMTARAADALDLSAAPSRFDVSFDEIVRALD